MSTRAAHADERALGAYERAVTLATTSRSRRAPLVLADALRALAIALSACAAIRRSRPLLERAD